MGWAGAEGTIQHYHIQSGKLMHTVVEEGNQIFTVDYKADASQFVTAGKDHKVSLTRAAGVERCVADTHVTACVCVRVC